ncbi:hypothetical protein A3H89_01905 [Candidatus Amesbacteria bacterium RIFCSPLOWO2_02_FULL_48_11]|uniref:Dockerin domain-containing protein n=1 Tax=Candidatus Amesbacteria bacterium RIFCSPHIGHO2_12_FULL_48_14 TaxID=1797257 RepID=A0A1F4Z8P7_9BACT|nr:MAG: hypothetical protein A2V48_00135 [Candidatus Amesbacteria bacterium RBG_19FT_COMBO_48_16]OGC96107.1 MAG: hypothetical protein A3C34_00440 [Candidatus Amesbacteria bacterium RIFCSPHIGHO2_02_FULL_48_21]OGC97549.1 MAG: hypothetical protein A2W16_03020 [Candidatus Amesbacteria bacterium RBG_16_48_31]OGC99928.1 MAG: hypothetical protein A2702_00165 [Candidatus Amesbacteria bacterium RIFCSPHIGHO2_01_FULL_48_75]OGD02729.1 MAG: hypothetical protein A3E17_02885 [Candidatus Amesbacteria bacterium
MTRLGLYLLLAFIAANYLFTRAARYRIAAQTCMTIAQVNADPRCLYILNSKVYQKGSRTNLHRNHPCGMDVSSIIPGNHLTNFIKYLDPNYVANICSVSPSPTATPTRTPTPIRTPTPTSPSVIPGDANNDGRVNGVDYVIWNTHYGQTGSVGPAMGDFNTSGAVDGVDYVIWFVHYGQ